MFTKFYAKLTPATLAIPAPYIVRDSRTKQIIASGDKETCINFVNSFGGCYLEGAA